MASYRASLSAALAAGTLLLSACEDLLPGRQAPPPVAAADSARAAPPTRPRPETPAATGAEAAAAFREISQTLRRLVAAEQGFFAENGTYAADLQRLGFRPTGASQVEFLLVTRDGWAARGTHPLLPGRDCVTYAGGGIPVPATRRYARSGREGVVVCDATTSPAPARPVPPPAAAKPPAAPDSTVRLDTTSALDAVSPAVQMRVDLRKLAQAQAAYFGTQGVYSRRLETLPLQFGWQRGVHVTLLHADQHSWAARATHEGRPGRSCVVWHGTPPTRPATQAQRRVGDRSGVPACDD
jgi:hypothetical protein